MSERNIYFDNAKFILMSFVLLGHVIESLAVNTHHIFFYPLYLFIYSFHMPTFVLISGYFSKRVNLNLDSYYEKNMSRIIIPYFIFQLLYLKYFAILTNRSMNLNDIFSPTYIMWYLFSLMLWKLMLPYFKILKFPIIISVVIAAFIGHFLSISSFFSLQRTFVFFPFFLIGYYMNERHIEFLKTNLVKVIALAAFFIIAIFFSLQTEKLSAEWLWSERPYYSFGFTKVSSAMIRVLVTIVEIVLATSFLSLVPKERKFFTGIGSKTMQIYLLHGFFAAYLSRYVVVTFNNWSQYLCIIPIVIVLLYILSRKIFSLDFLMNQSDKLFIGKVKEKGEYDNRKNCNRT